VECNDTGVVELRIEGLPISYVKCLCKGRKFMKAIECKECSDTGLIYTKMEDGTNGTRKCICKKKKAIEEALARIPEKFGIPKLEELQPREEYHPDQPYAVEYIKAHPNDSYLFAGANGTGKSHMAYALYTHAVFSGRPAIALTVRDLLAQFRRMELGEVTKEGRPYRAEVTMEDLKQKSTKWTILLDEFEKARVTEFTCEMLFALLDAAWKYGHQLLVTTNMDMPELTERWEDIDAVYGQSIAKRIAGACTGIGLFFDNEKEN
jgi:DNA replication protein DnaC